MKKALITGISGFVGSHLAELLLSENIEVHGYAHPKHSRDNIKHLEEKINLAYLDLLDKKSLEENLGKNSFDYIFHLAAFSSPSQSFDNAKDTLKNNIFAQLSLLEAAVKTKSKATILIVGSSDQYGAVSRQYLPIKEETPFAPTSPYAVSKIAQEMLGLQFFLHDNLSVVRVRPFNHIGPRQSKVFVVPAFASQIAALEKKGGGEIKIGNLNSFRDFTDVRDIVRAYLLALENGEAGEVYNIGSGHTYKIEDILNQLISLSSVEIKVKVDNSLIRIKDVNKIYCDPTKFQKKTGWNPKIPISKTLSDTIEYERSKLK